MAKEVDLSSREWCDLVFEGKNKDFGAYVIRTDSTKRHNKAVFWTIIGAFIFGLLAWGFVKTQEYLEERRLAAQGEQEEVLIDMSQEAEEPEPEQERLEQEKPEVLPEEVLKSVKVTELQIVEDDKVKKEWKEMKFSKNEEVNDSIYQEKAKKIRNDSTLKRPVVIIKATPNASYAHVVSVLDEMQINNISRYQIDRINEVDSAMMIMVQAKNLKK
jgi:protein TonB